MGTISSSSTCLLWGTCKRRGRGVVVEAFAITVIRLGPDYSGSVTGFERRSLVCMQQYLSAPSLMSQ